jgi:hypothetical protein
MKMNFEIIPSDERGKKKEDRKQKIPDLFQIRDLKLYVYSHAAARATS